ncbi:hypothetical protein F1645_13030 [Novacetimonas hansenii]|nr:hypothetical protein [Novacetimonas hansenii]
MGSNPTLSATVMFFTKNLLMILPLSVCSGSIGMMTGAEACDLSFGCYAGKSFIRNFFLSFSAGFKDHSPHLRI